MREDAPWPIRSTAELLGAFRDHAYLTDRETASVICLMLELRRPLLLEGEPGVGKTELAKVLAKVLAGRLIRLQCYEGIDLAHALYDWNHARQLLALRAAELSRESTAVPVAELFSEEFLVRRPLLEALSSTTQQQTILLIDEIDRADDEFEAFLLELLSDFQVTIPELGTVAAEVEPIVVLTSNRTRDLHDALRRRCLYHWLEHPDATREAEIIQARVPGVASGLAAQAAAYVEEVRALDLVKAPGVAETIDWVTALVALGVSDLSSASPTDVLPAFAALLKHPEDRAEVTSRLVG
jgi:MoxR-like ATPase